MIVPPFFSGGLFVAIIRKSVLSRSVANVAESLRI